MPRWTASASSAAIARAHALEMQVVITLLLSLLLLVPIALTHVSVRVDRTMTSVSLLIFGPITGLTGQRVERRTRLRSAHIPTTYPVYSALTMLYAVLIGISLSLFSMIGLYGLFALMQVDPEAMRAALPPEIVTLAGLAELRSISVTAFVQLSIAFLLVLGPWIAIGVYGTRWWLPAYEASLRERRIEAAMPRTLAFMYAMSRSGMSVPAIMAVLSRHREVYGAAADEMAVAVRNMEGFGVDMITAITLMGRRSASQRFREFSENLASVLQSGRDVPSFFRDQYERHQEEAEEYQEQLLTVLATTAEVWVTLLVGGPLFLITILVVIGITIQDTLPILQLVIYVVLPLANIAFIVYLGVLFDRIEGQRSPAVSAVDTDRYTRSAIATAPSSGAVAQADGGHPADRIATNHERLATHRRLQRVRYWVGNPVQRILDQPAAALAVTVPIALLFALVRAPTAIEHGAIDVRALDAIVLQGTLFVLVSFAIVYEIHHRRIDSIERNIPDLLDRLASVNEAGMTLVASIGQVRHSELGRLDTELGFIWRDLQWGATLETALRRFEHRVRTNLVSRVVTLLVMSMRASGEVSSVLRIAAAQAKADRRLKRARRQEMATYVFIAYLSFLVFLVVLGAMNSVLLPNLPEVTVDPGAVPGAVSSPLLGQIGAVDQDAYELIFYHAVLIQGFFSGLIAGHMSAADLRNGAKHAAVLLLIGWLAFWLIL